MIDSLPPTTLANLLGPHDAALLAEAHVPCHPDAFPIVAGFAYDSRKVAPGDIFFAWRGRVHDGHDHIAQAVAQGAAGVIAQSDQDVGVPLCVHPDPHGLLGRLAQARYNNPAADMQLVAVTGTNGKTTTAHLIAAILAAQSGCAGLLGTLGAATLARGCALPQGPSYGDGASLTTSEALDLVMQLARWRAQGICHVALEASSIALVEGRLRATPVQVAVWTNLTQDHLDYHGDMAAYFAAKALLFTDHLARGGVGVLPLALAHHPAFAGLPISTYCADAQAPNAATATVYRMPAQSHDAQAFLRIMTPQGPLAFLTPMVGQFNVENTLAAVAAAQSLQIPHEQIILGLTTMTAVPGRLEQVSLPASEGPMVLVDFAHTPDALARVIACAKGLTPGRVHLVFGCGGDRDATKRPVMGRIAAAADTVCVTSDNPRSEAPAVIAQAIVVGLVDGRMPTTRYTVQLDRAAAIRATIAQAAPKDVVLIAGKGHEPYQLIGGVKHPFDDRAVARAALHLPSEEPPL